MGDLDPPLEVEFRRIPEELMKKGSKALTRALPLVFLSAVLALFVAPACGSGDDGPPAGETPEAGGAGGSQGEAGASGTGAEGGEGGEAGASGAAGAAGSDFGNCTPLYTGCTGACGPITDACSGEQFECGACGEEQACNLDTHECEAPKVTCEDLGAECGRIKNSCGLRLDCGDCEEGLECDPDSNTCVPCSELTCQELGFECGPAWLGCGSRDLLTDCGTCPDGFVCSDAFNRCEPTPVSDGGSCVPKESAEACEEKDAECGFVSDGCGGTVFCGDCSLGEACAIRGIANRCGPPEPPLECVVAARECGALTSVCDGSTLNCGECRSPDVCNENGKCGPSCKPSLPDEADEVDCGTFDDGCDGTIDKKCAGSGFVCQSDNTCCRRNTCSDDYEDQCGTGLDDGCGGSINCGCGPGSCSTSEPGQTGTCCTKMKCSTDYEGICGDALDDGCGGTIKCSCPGNSACDIEGGAESGTCCELPSCGGEGAPCDTTLMNDCGSKHCGKNSCGAGLKCGIDNRCCTLPTRPTPTFCGTVSNSCGQRSFACGNNQVCIDSECCTLPSCGTQCDTTLTNECGSVTCSCSGSSFCNDDNQCCSRRTCGGHYKNQCGTALDDGCGGTLDCACSGQGNVCSSTQPGVAGTCSCGGLDCDDYPNQCGTFPNGCGGTLNCACSDHDLPAHMTCGGGNESGVCGCTPTGCSGRCGLVTNGCGGEIDCGPC